MKQVVFNIINREISLLISIAWANFEYQFFILIVVYESDVVWGYIIGFVPVNNIICC